MRQVPLEHDTNIAINGFFMVRNLHQERAISGNVDIALLRYLPRSHNSSVLFASLGKFSAPLSHIADIIYGCFQDSRGRLVRFIAWRALGDHTRGTRGEGLRAPQTYFTQMADRCCDLVRVEIE